MQDIIKQQWNPKWLALWPNGAICGIALLPVHFPAIAHIKRVVQFERTNWENVEEFVAIMRKGNIEDFAVYIAPDGWTVPEIMSRGLKSYDPFITTAFFPEIGKELLKQYRK